jgi:hypothetical protein
MEMRSPSSIGIGEQPGEAKMIASPVISWIKSHQVFIQALLVWGVLCLPGNIVTLILYDQVNSIPRQDNTSELMVSQYSRLSFKCLMQQIHQIFGPIRRSVLPLFFILIFERPIPTRHSDWSLDFLDNR